MFKEYGFEIYEDHYINNDIKRFVKKSGLIGPKKYYEKNTNKFMLNPIKLRKSNKIIDKSTFDTFELKEVNHEMIYFDQKTKKEI